MLFNVLEEHSARVEVVSGCSWMEEARNLCTVEVDGDDFSCAGGMEKGGDIGGADGDSRGSLPILPRVAIVWDNSNHFMG